jgi:S1-C subfamily serine protease
MTEHDFAVQIRAWKQKLIDGVVLHYRRGDQARGEQAFHRWKTEFARFLGTRSPSEAEEFERLMAASPADGGGWVGESAYAVFMSWHGNKCLAFLDELAEAATEGRIADLQMQNDQMIKERETIARVVSSSPHTADIRQFLIDSFSDEELTTLCFDHFRPVYGNFSTGMSKGQKIQLLLDYCTRRDKMPELLDVLAEARLEQFAQRFGTAAPRERQGHPGLSSTDSLPAMTASLDASVVAVCNARDQIVGTGFVASESLILTCAHVVQAAGSGPGGRVVVRFHIGGTQCEALVATEYWRPSDGDDIAVLLFDTALPAGATPVIMGNAEDSDGHPFRAFGYPPTGAVKGIWATGKIEGLVREADRPLLQLTSQNLAQGISGGPVLEETHAWVIGMVTSVVQSTGRHRDAGFATPADMLYRVCPDLVRPRNSVAIPFYTKGRINDPNQFFNRERLVREIRSELQKRVSVSLVGDSQMGKSSLLYYLYATREQWLPGVAVEYIDLQRILDECDFCEEVLKRLGETGDTLRDLKRVLETRQVILLLDEVERMAEPDFSPRLHDLLRSLGQEPSFAMCLATQRSLEAVFPAHTPGGVSPFHNIFTRKTIGPFSPDEARRLVRDRLRGTGVDFDDREIERLLNESRCHPAALQRLAKELFESLRGSA